MRMAKEVIGRIGFALAIIGGLMLFYSVFILAVFPEAERSAFPMPLGLPGLFLMSAGLAAYFASKIPVSGTDDVSDSPREGP
jgi:hypothetical protein